MARTHLRLLLLKRGFVARGVGLLVGALQLPRGRLGMHAPSKAAQCERLTNVKTANAIRKTTTHRAQISSVGPPNNEPAAFGSEHPMLEHGERRS